MLLNSLMGRPTVRLAVILLTSTTRFLLFFYFTQGCKTDTLLLSNKDHIYTLKTEAMHLYTPSPFTYLVCALGKLLFYSSVFFLKSEY